MQRSRYSCKVLAMVFFVSVSTPINTGCEAGAIIQALLPLIQQILPLIAGAAGGQGQQNAGNSSTPNADKARQIVGVVQTGLNAGAQVSQIQANSQQQNNNQQNNNNQNNQQTPAADGGTADNSTQRQDDPPPNSGPNGQPRSDGTT